VDTNGYLVCNGGALVFSFCCRCGWRWAGALNLLHLDTRTHIRTHVHTCKMYQYNNINNNNNNDNSNNNTTTEYDNIATQETTTMHFFIWSPALFPGRDESAINNYATTATTENPSMRILLLLFLLLLLCLFPISSSHCVYDFYYPHYFFIIGYFLY